MLVELLMDLFNKLGIIVIGAFILSKTSFFKKYVIKDKISVKAKIIFSIIFGLVGILGTYTGTPVNGAIANSRSIGVIVAGLFGGPSVGIGAGLIAGVHRMLIPTGRFTAIACGLSTIIGGIIAGFAKKKIDGMRNRWLAAALLAFIIEVIQMGMILLIARPFDDALELVKVIFIPMTFINSIGTGAFILLIEQIYDEHETVGARKAQLALNIAAKTIGILRKGLNKQSAEEVASLIMDNTELDACSITNENIILAHKGEGSDHHKTGGEIHTNVTKKAIALGEYQIAQSKLQIECDDSKCSLGSCIVVPLKIQEYVIGSIKLYRKGENAITDYDIVLAQGLAQLFSTQIELSEIQYQKSLTQKANFKALQAQIQPHFLFNALNTIIAFCRTDALRARELLIKLSDFLRFSFKGNEERICFLQEMEHVQNYLAIEEARFGDRINVVIDTDDNLVLEMPPLLIQPLVENALKHGLADNSKNGELLIKAHKLENRVLIEVKDNGKGMTKQEIEDVLSGKASSEGIGISNVKKRLEGSLHTTLEIDSQVGKGTTFRMNIPIKE